MKTVEELEKENTQLRLERDAATLAYLKWAEFSFAHNKKMEEEKKKLQEENAALKEELDNIYRAAAGASL